MLVSPYSEGRVGCMLKRLLVVVLVKRVFREELHDLHTLRSKAE